MSKTQSSKVQATKKPQPAKASAKAAVIKPLPKKQTSASKAKANSPAALAEEKRAAQKAKIDKVLSKVPPPANLPSNSKAQAATQQTPPKGKKVTVEEEEDVDAPKSSSARKAAAQHKSSLNEIQELEARLTAARAAATAQAEESDHGEDGGSDTDDDSEDDGDSQREKPEGEAGRSGKGSKKGFNLEKAMRLPGSLYTRVQARFGTARSTLDVLKIDVMAQTWKKLDQDDKDECYAILRDKYPEVFTKDKFPQLWPLKVLVQNAYANARHAEKRRIKNGGVLPPKKKRRTAKEPEVEDDVLQEEEVPAGAEEQQGGVDGEQLFDEPMPSGEDEDDMYADPTPEDIPTTPAPELSEDLRQLLLKNPALAALIEPSKLAAFTAASANTTA
ncbi:hypothetical protein FA13DRAFT_1713054 [Coprinellus micaceus]|uniref:Uncharacterized protein n=1 Tax=Coprinellus micaceus TaxID=71717 RepID=A0A4Y7SZP4_COPMI|nr:hypothetical protein FA13DRAFT_1713054 [Coprinellus micaceus]